MPKDYFREIGDNIWIERVNVGEFRACLNLRSEQIYSDNPAKRHKTSKEALAGLRREIKDEINWLKQQLKLLRTN